MAGTGKKKSASKAAAKRTPRKAAAKSQATRGARARKSTPARRGPQRAASRAAAPKTKPARKTAAAQSDSAERPERSIPALTRQMVAAAAAACEAKKAEDTRILELDASDAGFTDFFLITSGTNERQTQSIADEVELRLKQDFGTYPNSVEGKRQGEWVLLDYVDFVVHIFLAEKRAFYDIERLRKSARTVDLAELEKRTAAVRKRIAAKSAAAD
ncbi:MAG: Ribosomal silencing factor RsfA (former Iojap) [Acidobacteriaceae bacterium]|nr:Ribosomal silencing factor RsfA (former Iojap) [Acidobacteriaceae bacterium]